MPHFSTFGKNYVGRFQGTDLFEQIFYGVLKQSIDAGLVDARKVFIDGTHIKAHANKKKFEKKEVTPESLFYIEELHKEIQEEREASGRKALKSLTQVPKVETKKVSINDPESGWYHKGDHEEVFAYCAEVACDEHGWVLDFTVHPGNEHDSRTWKALYDKLQSRYDIEMAVMDAGYKTPAIAHELIKDSVTPVFPYKLRMTKQGFLKKVEFKYDDEFDGYTCPQGQWQPYRTTMKAGYKQYKSDPKICVNCPLLEVCTQSKNHQKVVSRHIWARDLEATENLSRLGIVKEIYDQRKETIERIFGTAKEFHGLRYTNQRGRDKLQCKLALTFTCLNIKKLAKMMTKAA